MQSPLLNATVKNVKTLLQTYKGTPLTQLNDLHNNYEIINNN